MLPMIKLKGLKMKTQDLLNKKYDDDKNLFQKCLHKIKPFKSVDGNVSLEMMEKYISLVQRKYALQIDYICPTFIPGEENLYSVTVRDTNRKEYLSYIYGASIYEVYVKVCILYFAVLNGNEFPLADWQGEKFKRTEKLKRITKYEN